MARFLVYKGRKVYRSGAYASITFVPRRRAALGFRGKLILVGEADEGAPGGNLITDPNTIKETLSSGPLADAAAKAFSPSTDEAIPGGASEVLAYVVNQATRATITMPGAETVVALTTAAGATGDSSAMVIIVTANIATADLYKKRWAKLVYATGVTEYRYVTASGTGAGTSTVSVAPGFSALPAAALALTILEAPIELTAKRYGVRMNDLAVSMVAGAAAGTRVFTLDHPSLAEPEVSPEILGQQVLRFLYTGGPVPANGTGTITAAAKNATTGKTEITLNIASAATLNAWATMTLKFNDGKQRLIEGNTAADPSVITLDLAHALTDGEIQLLNDLNTAGTPMSADVRNVATAAVTVEGAAGVATQIKTVVTGTADDFTWVFSTLGLVTLQDLISYVNNNTLWRVSVVPGVGINADTTLLSSLDFGSATGPAGVNCKINARYDDTISAALARETDASGGGGATRDVSALVEYINATSQVVTATRRAVASSQDGKELPSNTTSPIQFRGGSRGISTNANWQAAFTALLQESGQHIVALISRDLVGLGQGSKATLAAVAALLKTHLQAANGSARKARGGYIGFRGTRDAAIAFAKKQNFEQMQVFCEEPECSNVDGDLIYHPEWMMGVIAAASRAGSEIGEPMTAKSLAITGLRRDASWTPRSDSDVGALTQGGVMFAEEDARGAFRWVRDITTYLDDDDLDTKIEGSMMEETRFLADDLPAFVEQKFRGRKLKTGAREGRVITPASVRQAVIERCELYRDAPYFILAASKDPDDPTGQKVVAEGYDRITVNQSGNTMPINGRFFMASGIVFVPMGMSVHTPEL